MVQRPFILYQSQEDGNDLIYQGLKRPKIDGSQLNFASEVKNLRITFDGKLTRKFHVQTKLNNKNRTITITIALIIIIKSLFTPLCIHNEHYKN